MGHATLATGADPSRHGIVANDWIDQKTGAFVYNTEDERHHSIGREPKAHEGVSPRNLLASNISDELVVNNGGSSRVFSVSVKDRGAILPGGHAGKAFWFSKSSGNFVTSTYYYNDYPAWVKQWNATKPADAFKGKSWELLNDRATYVHGQMDGRPYEADLKPLGRIFPHPLGGDTKYFYLLLTLTPDLPLDRQIRIGTGIQYDWNKDVTVGAAYEYLDAGEAEIDQEEGGPFQGPLKGDYDTNAIHFFAFNLIWKF